MQKIFLLFAVVIFLFPLQTQEQKSLEESLTEDTITIHGSDRKYVRIAAWNIRIFSNRRTDEELAKICKIAKNFDVIAITELKDEDVLKRMITMLGKNHRKRYAYELSERVGNTSRSAEGLMAEEENNQRFADGEITEIDAMRGHTELYAFLYDSSFIECIKPGKLYTRSGMFRHPYYATFKAKSFDFTLIVTHVIWGDRVSQRRQEINRLAQIYKNIQNYDNENDVLLLGDFNRSPNDDLAWGPMKSISGMVHVFDLPQKSMIWDSHLYDNIWFQSQYTKEFTLDSGIIHFDEEDFGNDDRSASKAVSDHRPVWAKFRITDRDDD